MPQSFQRAQVFGEKSFLVFVTWDFFISFTIGEVKDITSYGADVVITRNSQKWKVLVSQSKINFTGKVNMTITFNDESGCITQFGPIAQQIPSEIELLRTENEALRSAISVMSAKLSNYHAKACKMQKAYLKSIKPTEPNVQAIQMERLENALKSSHKAFLKMEQKNKNFVSMNQILREQNDKTSETLDSSALRFNDDVSTRYFPPHFLAVDVECETLFTDLPSIMQVNSACNFEHPSPLNNKSPILNLP
jgi:hypothetical protein